MRLCFELAIFLRFVPFLHFFFLFKSLEISPHTYTYLSEKLISVLTIFKTLFSLALLLTTAAN